MANLTDIVIAELLRPPQPHGWSDAFYIALAFGAVFAVAALEYGLAAEAE